MIFKVSYPSGHTSLYTLQVCNGMALIGPCAFRISEGRINAKDLAFKLWDKLTEKPFSLSFNPNELEVEVQEN